MKKIISLTVILILLFGFFQEAEAQKKRGSNATLRRQNRQVSTFTQRRVFSRNKQYITFGLNLGTSTYFGDLAPRASIFSFDAGFTRPNIGVFATRRVHPNIAIRGGFNWMRIQGDDYTSQDPDNTAARYRYVRNHHFRNDIKELSFTGTFDLYGNNSTYIRRRDNNPYAFIGISVFHHNPKALSPESFGKEWVALQPLGTEGQGRQGYKKKYSLIGVGIPVGVGFKKKLLENLDLSFEIGYRFVFTDYLDDVGGMFANPDDFEANSLAQAMAFRSAEPIAVRKGEDRKLALIMKGLGPRYEVQSSNGAQYVTGYAERNQIRGGGSGKDYFVVTGFHLSYIITNKAKAPKFR